MGKSPSNSAEYKAFMYAEEARTRANLKRLVPAIVLVLLISTYLFIYQMTLQRSYNMVFWVEVSLFSIILALALIYSFLVVKLMNKSQVNICAGKWTYMSFWVIAAVFVFVISLLIYLKNGHFKTWYAFFALAAVAPIFDKFETFFIVILSEILAMTLAITMGVPVIIFLISSIPIAAIITIVFQTAYISRMRVLLTQSKIEQRGYMVQRRMESIFDDLFDEVYEIDLNKNYFTLVHSKGTFRASYMKDSYQKSVDYISNTLIHPDDQEQYANRFSIDNIKSEFREGKKQIYHEARRLTSTGDYKWVSTLMIREYTENNEEFRLMQLIQDIDNRKTSEVKLKTEAQTDPLTQLYNKMTTKTLIEEYICGEGAEGLHAFIIIDMDEFKAINDTHGHFVGDNVLEELSKELKGYFRESDILGRIGGDEFVAFIKNIQSVALVCDKVQRLSASLKKYGIEHGYAHKLSTSMGIAVFNKDGKTYDELYKNADKALYEAKRNGKDQYKFSIRSYDEN